MKTKGFTLLESVVALFLLSLFVGIVPLVIGNNQEISRLVTGKNNQIWHVFLIQMENKFSEGEYDAVIRNKIYFRKPHPSTNYPLEVRVEFNQARQEIILRENNGFEPILTNVSQMSVKEATDNLYISVTFQNGEIRNAKWTIPPKT